MIAPFQNPHLFAHSIAQTTRANLYGINDNSTAGLDSQEYTEQTRRLDSLLRMNIGEFPAFQVGKVRKRKRGQDDVLQDTPSFRLISSSFPPIAISLLPKPSPPSKIREPECEDNETQAEQRMRLAQSIAVDANWVLEQSLMPYIPWRTPRSEIIQLPELFQFPSPDPPMLLVPKTSVGKHDRRHSPPSCPSHHDSGSSRLCILPATLAIQDRAIDKVGRRRKRKRKRIKEKICARFWRPDPSIRGKSAGYALGY